MEVKDEDCGRGRGFVVEAVLLHEVDELFRLVGDGLRVERRSGREHDCGTQKQTCSDLLHAEVHRVELLRESEGISESIPRAHKLQE